MCFSFAFSLEYDVFEFSRKFIYCAQQNHKLIVTLWTENQKRNETKKKLNEFVAKTNTSSENKNDDDDDDNGGNGKISKFRPNDVIFVACRFFLSSFSRNSFFFVRCPGSKSVKNNRRTNKRKKNNTKTTHTFKNCTFCDRLSTHRRSF